MKIIHERLFGKKFDFNDSNFFGDLVTPVELNTVINKVSRASGDVRGHGRPAGHLRRVRPVYS